jgi:dihydroorotate dehydrogenase
MYRYLLKPVFFLLAPERAHALAMQLFEWLLRLPLAGQLLRRQYSRVSGRSGRQLMGLWFPNAVGLAAGFDKDGRYIASLGALGFGFLEIGTVTPRPQAGNPAPRLFRLPADRALINRMGFNNEGVDALVERLRALGENRPFIIGGNIGKNKDTPNEQAVDDYLYCFEQLHPYVDYFVVNVSSPNTPNLRALQDKEPLAELLGRLQARNRQLAEPRPILLKIAPDLNESQLDDIIDLVRSTGIAGLVATNTTTDRSGLQTEASAVASMGAGGLSGAPLRARSTAVIRYLREQGDADMVIIGVGGIDSAAAAKEKMAAGADLVQLYTGYIYEGPGLVKRIAAQL